MAENGNRSSREQVLDELRSASKLVVVTHENPDGDALGSLIAMQEMLLALARHEVGNRPGRLEPRRIKRRPKPHKLLNTPRSTARRLEVRDTYE